ncbi:SPOR domain-containing protein [Arcobacter roscoffensis]|uniref:SPOR domain-containing protein n=1 Tax=Arcobacter roscoffensis TaxID=2961520 RepID=A0ABY5E621_9BACT|nr:SPOR domain-containing protein [Arcobacter roscoffensis]UTJ07312.1 SPOR domain-containing protein [Arcobacter roscoffensis]
MEIKGDDFLKKIQVHQEREELEQKLNELEEVENHIGQSTSPDFNNTPPKSPRVNEDPSEQELDNIMLQSSKSNEENKKRYLILGLVLVVVFLLTIIVIRLLTDSPKEDPFTSNQTETQLAQTGEDANIEENFQKIMNDRVKKSNDDEEIISEEKLNEIKQSVIQEEEPKKEASIEESDLDATIAKIKEQKKKEVEEKKEEVKKEIKKEEPKVTKQEPKKTVKQLIQNTSDAAPKGYFVQIGAFSKTPSASYINKIRDANLKYKIYKVEVKGKMYNKVLIGPYSSRATAKQNIDDIKKKLNLSGAYVLKF